MAFGMRIAQGLGIALVAYGIAVAVFPWLLPGGGGMGTMGMGTVG